MERMVNKMVCGSMLVTGDFFTAEKAEEKMLATDTRMRGHKLHSPPWESSVRSPEDLRTWDSLRRLRGEISHEKVQKSEGLPGELRRQKSEDGVMAGYQDIGGLGHQDNGG